jgi:hypothetical protein
MPWTFAHPAAVIPLRRYCPAPLNFPALVIGSMIPDVGYHVLRKDIASYAHSLEGSLLVCLPAGLLLLAVLCMLRKPLWYLLPEPHRTAFAPVVAADPSLRRGTVIGAGISILLGAWTHIAWDSLTHRNGWIALRVALLQEPVFQLNGVDFPLYHLLQHLSSYLGVAAIVISYSRWLRRAPVSVAYFQREDIWRYLLLAAIAAAAILTGVTLAATAAESYDGYFAWRAFMFRGAVDGMSAFLTLYVIGAVLCYRARRTA